MSGQTEPVRRNIGALVEPIARFKRGRRPPHPPRHSANRAPPDRSSHGERRLGQQQRLAGLQYPLAAIHASPSAGTKRNGGECDLAQANKKRMLTPPPSVENDLDSASPRTDASWPSDEEPNELLLLGSSASTAAAAASPVLSITRNKRRARLPSCALVRRSRPRV